MESPTRENPQVFSSRSRMTKHYNKKCYNNTYGTCIQLELNLRTMMDLLQTRLTFHFYCACEHHLKCVFKALQRTRWINSSSAQLSCTPTLRDLFEKILIELIGKLAFRVARVSIYRPKVVLGSFTSCGINNRNLRGNWRENFRSC